jgi:two-component system response regulator RegX3
MQVVLVTDNPDERDYYTYVLHQVGFDVSPRAEFPASQGERSQSQGDLYLVIAKSAESMPDSVSRLRSHVDAPLFILVDNPLDSQVADLLEAGADLVLSLPISPRVLAAYCRNQMRRSGDATPIAQAPIKIGSVDLDPSVRSVRVGRRKPRHLTQLEFRLLYLLMTHRGQVIPPDVIVDRVWGYAESGSRELVRGLISRLRSKIETDPTQPRLVRTVPGVGYVFDAE